MVLGGGVGFGREPPCRGDPGGEPQQRHRAEQQEDAAPAELGHQEPAEEDAEGRPDRQPLGHQAVGEAQPVAVDVLGDQLGRAGEGRALAHAQQQAQGQDHRKAGGESGEEGGEPPDGQADGQRTVGVHLLGHPAGQHLARHIGPEEGRGQDADLRAREAELVLEQRGGGREVAAVDVVDEHRQREERYDQRAERGSRGRSRSSCSHSGVPPNVVRADRGMRHGAALGATHFPR